MFSVCKVDKLNMGFGQWVLQDGNCKSDRNLKSHVKTLEQPLLLSDIC